MADFIWAEDTGDWYFMPCSAPGVTERGAQPLLLKLESSAPIWPRGDMIRCMGLAFRDASPESTAGKSCPARMPQSSLVVVPLLPVYNAPSGAERPRRPFPCTSTQSGFSSIVIPIFRKQEMVDRQSAPFKKCVISVVPRAMEPSMTARWEMDLSPGTSISPLNRRAG